MFFIFSFSNKEKDLDFSQSTICKTCGAYGRLEAFMTYSYFSLFFIPIFKWNKKYFIKSSCCGTIYGIDKSLGKSIQKGENIKVAEDDLQAIGRNYRSVKYCKNCNTRVEDDFEYCPKCGQKL